ncbi:MAG: carboxypeptidase regulatory-like domain-containing protein [Acidobacteria bacterium]|nr:carboxypeptidase regulatory-like domain-containing protein [Acidobacteriota bacterium]
MKSQSLLIALLVLSLSAQAQPRAPRRLKAVITTASSTPAAAAETPNGQTLPIRRVILYSNGVAYIERRGTVTGHAEINLSFKQSQVDDVLKSMVVLDLGQGQIGAVSYNSSAPPAARMADIPFSVQAETGETHGGLAGVLSQLQGARVLVMTANRTATGSILTVEQRRTQPDKDKPAAVTHALVIASESGELSSFPLEEVRSVKLIDEGARRDIKEFASATASARRRDAKTITVTSDGAGAREMLVSYTVAAPIWKTTYRVVLDAVTGKPFFQGWAIVDNVSDEDWNDVQLSLISGTPISFIQPIQKPFYRYRPVIPRPADLKLDPQVHEPEDGSAAGSLAGTIIDPNGAAVPNAIVRIMNQATNRSVTVQTDSAGNFNVPALGPGAYTLTASAPGFNPTVARDVRVNAGFTANVNMPLQVGSVNESVSVTGESVQRGFTQRQVLALPPQQNSVNNMLINGAGVADKDETVRLSEAITGADSGVTAAAEGSEVGDLFEYQISQPVTVKRDRSALIPILQTRMEGARVSIYNESARRDRPMSGMLLKNTSTLTLEDGAMTIIDGNAYAGEALMERLKPQEQRLISFALDLGTLVNVRQLQDRAPAFRVQIINGVFQAHYHREDKKTYTLTNQTDKPRVVYVEHPVRPGWELSKDTPQPEGKSARYYRFRVALEPFQKSELLVAERQALMDTYAVSNVTPDDLRLFVARRYIDDKTHAELQTVIELKSRIAGANARATAIDQEIEEISKDQERLRENITALNSTAEAKQLIARYVAKANSQETRIEELTKEKQAVAAERAQLQSQLDNAIRALSIDRNLAD